MLDEISRYIELTDPKPFRARAFEKAARQHARNAVQRIGETEDVVARGGVDGHDEAMVRVHGRA